jgi:YesN/AraC family two-component response regulator
MHATPAPTAVVADDERLMREQVVGCLKQAWPELLIVGEASTGAKRWRWCRASEPDIVFLDIRMPELDGVEVRAAARGTGPRRVGHANDEYGAPSSRARSTTR